MQKMMTFFTSPLLFCSYQEATTPQKEEGEGKDKIKDKSQMDSRTELKACIIKSSSYALASF